MKKKQRKKTRRRERGASGVHLAAFLELIALAVEAAGSFDAALRSGAISVGDKADIEALRSIVPVSRGGKLDHPDADGDWVKLVDSVRKQRNLDFPGRRSDFGATCVPRSL